MHRHGSTVMGARFAFKNTGMSCDGSWIHESKVAAVALRDTPSLFPKRKNRVLPRCWEKEKGLLSGDVSKETPKQNALRRLSGYQITDNPNSGVIHVVSLEISASLGCPGSEFAIDNEDSCPVIPPRKPPHRAHYPEIIRESSFRYMKRSCSSLVYV